MRPNQKLKQLPLTVRVMLFPNASKLEHTNFFSRLIRLFLFLFVCFVLVSFFLMIRCFAVGFGTFTSEGKVLYDSFISLSSTSDSKWMQSPPT